MGSRFKYGLPVMFEGRNGADCRDVFTFWDDFLDSSISATVNAARWKGTIIAGGVLPALFDGTDASQELAGGIVALGVGGTDSDQSSMMVNGEAFQIAVGHELYFESRVMVADTDISVFVGLSDSDAECIAALANGIGFLLDATALKTSVAKTTANIDTITGVTIAADTWYNLAFHFDGIDTIKFYYSTGANPLVEVNSLSLTTTLDYIPDDIMLTPTLEAEETTAAGAGNMLVDFVLCQQARQKVAD